MSKAIGSGGLAAGGRTSEPATVAANGAPEPGEGLRFFLARAEGVDPDAGHASSHVLVLLTAEDLRHLADMQAACVTAGGTRMVGAAPGCLFARPARAWIEKIALWTAVRDELGLASVLEVELDLCWMEVIPPASTDPWYGQGAAGFGVPVEMAYTEIVVGADGFASLVAREEETGADLRTPEVHLSDLARR